MCLEKKICLRQLKKPVRLQAQQFCASAFSLRKSQVCSLKESMWWPGKLRLHKSCHQLSEKHSAASKKKQEEKVHLKESDFNVFNTHYGTCLASVRPPRSSICHSQRAYDTAIWKSEIIWGEGRRHCEGQEAAKEREVDGLKPTNNNNNKKKAECSMWIHLEYYSILSCMFWKCSYLHSAEKKITQEENDTIIILEIFQSARCHLQGQFP